jgi:hypothetical protein
MGLLQRCNVKFRQYAIAATIVACVSAGNASAQTSSQPSQPTANAAVDASATNSPAMNSDTSLNPGTLAESANTTALTTSSYHQGNGLFSWFDR